MPIHNQAIIRTLYKRIDGILADGVIDDDEKADLLDTLSRFVDRDFELGETLKAISLPLCTPAPLLQFDGRRYCFTGTFNYGQRKHCEAAVVERGASAGGITQKRMCWLSACTPRVVEALFVRQQNHAGS